MPRLMLNIVAAVAIGLGLIWMLFALMSITPIVRSAGLILYVAPAGSDASDCTNAVQPCATIQYAVDQAEDSAEIRVATGVYTGVTPRLNSEVLYAGTVTQVVYISKSLSLRGGYSLADWTTAYPLTQPATIDAETQGRVLYIIGDISVTIEGLQIERGLLPGSLGCIVASQGACGSGVHVVSATVTLSNNKIFSNTAYIGGGLYFYHSVSTLSHNIVISNVSIAGGGLLAEGDSTMALIGNSFMANGFTPIFATSWGGGVLVRDSKMTLYEDVLHSNTAADGGGLTVWNSTVTMTNASLISNTAYRGGGVIVGVQFSSESNVVTLANSKIVSNTAFEGGGLYVDEGDVVVIDNTIAGNAATTNGGGIYYYFVDHSVLQGNTIIRCISEKWQRGR